MILNYNYWYFISALPPEVCNQIVEYGLTKLYDQELKYGSKSTDATTGDMKQKDSLIGESTNAPSISQSKYTIDGLKRKGISAEKSYIRDSKVTFLDDRWLYELIWPYIKKANDLAGWNFEWDFTENLQFTKYGPGQFYGWHADASMTPYELWDKDKHEIYRDKNGEPIYGPGGATLPTKMELTENPNMVGKIRKLSTTISLNDPSEYQGGNLRFDLGPHRGERYHTCKEIRPQGSIIVFPSHVYHQVTPVTKGTRYSLVSWSLGQPWK